MIKLLGIPMDANSSFLRGAAQAPDRIRQMDLDGSANRYSELGIEIIPQKTYVDLGNLSFESDDPATAFHLIRDTIEGELKDESRLLSLGGDHSISYPILSAYSQKYEGLHVLHLDAHGDLYDDYEGNTFSHASPFARVMELGRIASLTQIGIRTLTDHQRHQGSKFGVRIIEMKDHDPFLLKSMSGPLYISLDIDALDPAFAPGVSHHEPGGFSTREVIEILHNIEVDVVGADIVECNPARDINNMTSMVAYKMMKEILGLML